MDGGVVADRLLRSQAAPAAGTRQTHPDEDADDGVQHRRTTVLGSPFEFKQYGQSGTPVSELFPNVATCVDDLTIVRSMVSDHSEHTAANYFMHSGSGFQGRPSMGGWVVYGLGSECKNLPGFIVLESGLVPPGGLDLFGSGFLPASYQGTLFRKGRASRCRSDAARGFRRNAAGKARSVANVEQRRARSLWWLVGCRSDDQQL